MRGVVIIGGSGLGEALAVTLRAHDVTVVLAERAPPVADFSAEVARLVFDAAMVREVPQFARPLPVLAGFVANLPIRSSWQVDRRWMPRHRELRTRGKR